MHDDDLLILKGTDVISVLADREQELMDQVAKPPALPEDIYSVSTRRSANEALKPGDSSPPPAICLAHASVWGLGVQRAK